jgi:hypothetical protein
MLTSVVNGIVYACKYVYVGFYAMKACWNEMSM